MTVDLTLQKAASFLAHHCPLQWHRGADTLFTGWALERSGLPLAHLSLHVLVVVGRQVSPHEFSSPVRVQVTGHVITHLLHVGAHLIKLRSRDEVAYAVDLPGDRRVERAVDVVSSGAGSRACVCGNVNAHLIIRIDDHAAGEVGVVVVLVVDDGEDLTLHTHIISNGLRC